eukprot:EG_transcript_1528
MALLSQWSGGPLRVASLAATLLLLGCLAQSSDVAHTLAGLKAALPLDVVHHSDAWKAARFPDDALPDVPDVKGALKEPRRVVPSAPRLPPEFGLPAPAKADGERLTPRAAKAHVIKERERGPLAVLLAFPVLASLLFTLRRGMVGLLNAGTQKPTAIPPEAPRTPPPPAPVPRLPKLPWRPEGWGFWRWHAHGGPHAIHYVARLPKPDPDVPRKTPIVLVHGFGASLHHWRYNIPALAATGHPVYALDLLGFGLSEKPLVEYQSNVWRDQVADFVCDIVGEPAVLVGNSIGGYTVLSAAAQYPQVAKAVVLLNAAGRFEAEAPPDDATKEEVAAQEPSPLDRVLAGMQSVLTKAVITGSFYVAKHPARIRSVLNFVYSVDRTNVDDELVHSIEYATRATTAPEVFYRIIHRNRQPNTQSTIDCLLAKLSASPRPLLLLWGEKDPWIRPQAGNAIQRLYPRAERVSLAAGHCPHDEVPALVNDALLEWIGKQQL